MLGDCAQFFRNMAGVYTVRDETLWRHLHLARTRQGLRFESSAAAGLSDPSMLLDTPQGWDYLQRHGLAEKRHNSMHIAWLTGGSLMPDSLDLTQTDLLQSAESGPVTVDG